MEKRRNNALPTAPSLAMRPNKLCNPRIPPWSKLFILLTNHMLCNTARKSIPFPAKQLLLATLKATFRCDSISDAHNLHQITLEPPNILLTILSCPPADLSSQYSIDKYNHDPIRHAIIVGVANKNHSPKLTPGLSGNSLYTRRRITFLTNDHCPPQCTKLLHTHAH